jgi:Zn-dependent protease with chaperone function
MLLQDFHLLTPEQKMHIIFTIRHEVAHLEHEDMLKNIIALLVCPLLSHGIVSACTYPFSSLFSSSTPLALQALLQIPSALAKLAISGVMFKIFCKYKEYCADKKAAESIQDQKILEYAARICQRIYDGLSKQIFCKNRIVQFIYDEINTPDSDHPNYALRATVYNNAYKKLVERSASSIR